MRILRGLNREEDMTLLYVGGVRSGTDSAKLVGLGANAVVVGYAPGAGRRRARSTSGGVSFYGDRARPTGPRPRRCS